MRNQKAQSINILNNINKYIIQTNTIKKNQFILISISGGQDSICMFFILLQLKKQWGWTFGIVYCNHLWQQNSFYTTSLILKLGLLFKIPVYITIPIIKIFNEKQARYWRYDSFYRLSFFYNYKIIVTGHTYSDKTETVLFQLTRGSSTKSLTSLHFIKYFLSSNKFSQHTTFPIKYFTKTHTLKNTPLAALKSAPCLSKTRQRKIKKLFNKNYFSHFFPCKARQRKKMKLEKSGKFVKSEHFVKTTENPLKKNSSISKHKICSVIINNTDKINYNNILALEVTKFISPRILARPLLSVHRFDLKKLSIFWNLPIYPDKSNQKKNYYRNRIRKQLLPTLRFFFNPQIDNIFFQFSEITSTEQIYLDIILNRLKLEFLNKNKIFFQINTSLFSYIPLAIQRKLIKYFLENCSEKQIQFEKIESILQTIVKKKFTKETAPQQSFAAKFYFSFNSFIPIASILSPINQFSDNEVIYCKNMLPKVLLPKTKRVFLQQERQCKKYIEKKLKNKIQIKKKPEQQNTSKSQNLSLPFSTWDEVRLNPSRCKAIKEKGQKITILPLPFQNKKTYIYFTKKKPHNISKELLCNQFSFKHIPFKKEFFCLNFALHCQAKKQVKYFLIKKKNSFNFKLYFLLVKSWIKKKKQHSLTNYTQQIFSKKITLNIFFNQQYFGKFEVYFCSKIGILFCFKKNIIFINERLSLLDIHYF